MQTSVIPAAVTRLFTAPGADANVRSLDVALSLPIGKAAGLVAPHRMAHFLAQLAHESVGFRYDREIWGNTPAQQRYDTRTDLGNTPEVDGDGRLYAGRTAVQITGKANVAAFTAWAKQIDPSAPDFVATPDLLNTDPWEGLVPIWYWTVGNPTGKSLNVLADANNIEQITRKINGGLNGYPDRLAWYDKIALAMCYFGDVETFQKEAKVAGLYSGEIDGENGPLTRAALHQWLASLSDAKTAASPVVQKVAEVPPEVEHAVRRKFNFFGWIAGLVSSGGVSLAGLAGMDWKAIVAVAGALVAVSLLALVLKSQIVAAVREISDVAEG